MQTLWQDLRYALRMQAKSPGFTAVAVIILALGIGANTAIFSVLYGVLIRPLAIPEARQVVQVTLNSHGELSDDNFTYNEFRYLQEHSIWPSAFAAFTHVGFNTSTRSETQRVSALQVSSDYFRVLGANSFLGRAFSLEEDRDPKARVVILGNDLWQHQFAAAPSVIGKTIHLNGSPYQVISVMPSSSSEIQLDWVPPAFGDLLHVDLWSTLAPVVHVNPGFQPSGVLSAEIWLTGSRIHSSAELTGFYDNLTARLKPLPGVQQAAVVSFGQPLERGGNLGVTVNGASCGSMDCRVVTPDYFRTLRVAFKNGRDFSPVDAESTPPVVIVNQAFDRKVLKGSDPFAATVQTSREAPPRRIVGVVSDVKSHVDLPEGPTIFLPASQTKFGLILGYDLWFPTHILLRTAGDPLPLANEIRSAIRETDSSISGGRILSMEQVLVRTLATQRFLMVVVAVFAGMALALAAIGIYGVISFCVSRRTHELGIRMALGAHPSSVLSLVLRDGTRLALLGAALGIFGAVALHQTLANALFGVPPTDARPIAVSSICLLSVALLACYIPARRATKVDPMVALRYE